MHTHVWFLYVFSDLENIYQLTKNKILFTNLYNTSNLKITYCLLSNYYVTTKSNKHWRLNLLNLRVYDNLIVNTVRNSYSIMKKNPLKIWF